MRGSLGVGVMTKCLNICKAVAQHDPGTRALPRVPPRRARQRGIGTLDLVAGAAAILGAAVVAALLIWSPDAERTASGPISGTLVFMVGSGGLYKQAEGDAKVYLDMLNSAGPMAEAMGSVGASTGPMAGPSIARMFDLPAGQLPAPLP